MVRMPLMFVTQGKCPECGGPVRTHVDDDGFGQYCKACGWNQGSAYGERWMRKSHTERTVWESMWLRGD
jgi:hypothetical protein